MSSTVASFIGACCLVIASALASGTSKAGDASEVGVIVDYSPPGASLFLERTGVKQPVRIATLVQSGDKISLPASSSVTVELADSRRMSSSGPGTWEVPASPALGAIATYFHRMELVMEPDYRRTGSAITRGLNVCSSEPIIVPVLPDGAQVMAGQRGLSLAWKGGCAPYRLEVKSEHGVLGVEGGIASHGFRFEQVSMDPGPYSVLITDSRGVSATLPFAARSDGPAWPPTLAGDTSHLGTAARALWLSDVDHGAWRIDSLELLQSLRRQHDRLAEAVSARILGQAAR